MTPMNEDALAARYMEARRIAAAAGRLALDYFRQRAKLVVELKGPSDFVSHADRDVENLIRRALAAAFPDDAFLGEETAVDFAGPVDRCWVVDPIDGTHNFLRGVPYWNVAIGFVANGRTQVGVVVDPAGGALFHAQHGHGAFCTTDEGEARLHVASTARLAGAYIVLGHHDRHPENRYLDIRRRMMASGTAMRNFGSAALQLAHVAEGRYDGFVELELSAWDAVAGLLLVEEAGGYHVPFAPATPTAKAPCLACAPGIARELKELVGTL
jgi:myo-inositol-1(or 4)-monophosphatase